MPEFTDTLDRIEEYLRKEFELDDEDIEEMLQEYFNNLASLIAKAESQLDNSSWEDLRRSAHSIKGASANLGADSLAAFGKALEKKAEDGDKKEAFELIEEIKKGLEKLREAKNG